MENSRNEVSAGARSRRAFTQRLVDWAKFGLGLLAILAFAQILARGLTPPGPAGEVLRHNQKLALDATPLFYTEVEDFAELERALPARSDGRIRVPAPAGSHVTR